MTTPNVEKSILSGLIRENIQRSIDTKSKLINNAAVMDAILAGGNLIAGAMGAGHLLLLAGNGGSASDAQHIATEFVIRYRAENVRRALPALSLATDTSALTAGGNDIGFENVFARQVEALGRAGDVFLGISTSGNSPNIIAALKEAKTIGIATILLTGETGGRIMADHAGLVDVAIRVPSRETSRIQECHIMIGQIFCALVEKVLFNFD